MSDLLSRLASLLASLDQGSHPNTEHAIARQIADLRDKGDSSEPPLEWRAEVMAFQFQADYRHEQSGWGTYYGPMMVWANGDGTATESPSIQKVTTEVLQYWERRSAETMSPLLRQRYADLVWDFSPTVLGRQADYRIGLAVVDATTDIAELRSHKRDTEVKRKLERALSIALQLNDSGRVEKLRDAIIAFEDAIAEDDKPGLWGFSFDLLCSQKKVALRPDQRQKLVDDLEARLERLTTGEIGDRDPWAAEHAALRLAQYYRGDGRDQDVERVLLRYGSTFEQISVKASAAQAAAWRERVHDVYVQFGLREHAESLAVKLRETGSEVVSGMEPLSVSTTIPSEEMEEYVRQMTEGDLADVLHRITLHYIERRGEAEKALEEMADKLVFANLAPTQLLDHEGRVVATIGPLADDLEGNVCQHMAQKMVLTAPFVRHAMAAMVQKFSLSADGLMQHLCEAPVFPIDQTGLVRRGIQAYLDADHIVSLHLLVPQIEVAFRKLLQLNGLPVMKRARSGGFHLRTLDDILRDPQIEQVFGPDCALYFRVVLTDQRGWNLRNNICHGMIPAMGIGAMECDRTLHVLLCLAAVRAEGDMGNEGSSDEP